MTHDGLCFGAAWSRCERSQSAPLEMPYGPGRPNRGAHFGRDDLTHSLLGQSLAGTPTTGRGPWCASWRLVDPSRTRPKRSRPLISARSTMRPRRGRAWPSRRPRMACGFGLAVQRQPEQLNARPACPELSPDGATGRRIHAVTFSPCGTSRRAPAWKEEEVMLVTTAIRPPLAPVAHDAHHLLRPLLDQFEDEHGSVLASRRDAAAMSLSPSYSTLTSSRQ